MSKLFVFIACLALSPCAAVKRSFRIDYDGDRFLKDDEPFQIIGGAINYFFVPPDYWQDRILKARAGGLNTIGVYVAWNMHEQSENEYTFDGWSDIVHFIQLVTDAGMLVLLRPGPYIDAEWDYGGLPWWLLKYPQIKPRTADPIYLAKIERWFTVLFDRLRPHLYENGGPIVAVQVENEYGSFPACDRNYTSFLRDLLQRLLGDKIILFTTDGNAEGYLRCGVVENVYATVDFGANNREGVQASFAAQRKYSPKGPLVNSEFYPGWADYWFQKHHYTENVTSVLTTMDYMWEQDASFTFYLIAGGTVWGYAVGADPGFSLVTTSYDYDAPISECGDPTPKLLAIRKHIEDHFGIPNPYPVPPPTEKIGYGTVQMRSIGNVFTLLSKLCPPSKIVRSVYPLNVEQFDFPFGFVLYETTAPANGQCLNMSGVHDRGYLFRNGAMLAMIQRNVTDGWILTCSQVKKGDKVQVLVENQGRLCYGGDMTDRKGLIANLTLDGKILSNWTTYPLYIERIFKCVKSRQCRKKLLAQPQRHQAGVFIPSFYYGSFATNRTADTFLDTTGWSKGQAFVNGANLGRYWPGVGPQISLFVPRSFLVERPATNRVLMFDLDGPQIGGTITFLNKMKWN